MITPRPLTKSRQSGSILLVSLIFLMVLGFLGMSAMQTSRLELRMATNEEIRLSAFQQAKALADAVVAIPAMTPVKGNQGFKTCTNGQAGCNDHTLFMPDPLMAPEVANGHLTGEATLTSAGNRPPPRGLITSADKFAAASFEVVTTYDRADEGLGRAQTTLGLLVLTPQY